MRKRTYKDILDDDGYMPSHGEEYDEALNKIKKETKKIRVRF